MKNKCEINNIKLKLEKYSYKEYRNKAHRKADEEMTMPMAKTADISMVEKGIVEQSHPHIARTVEGVETIFRVDHNRSPARIVQQVNSREVNDK